MQTVAYAFALQLLASRALRSQFQVCYVHFAYAFVLQLFAARALRSQFQVCYAHFAYAPIILRAPASWRATACSVNCLFATQVWRNSLLGPRAHGVKY